MYRGEDMARDIVEILMSEGVGMMVGVAHDWYVKLVRFSGSNIQVVLNVERAVTMLTLHPSGDASFCHD
jgi:hypothetical protein